MDKKEKDCGLLIAVLLAGVALGVVAGVVVLSLFYPAFQSDKWAAWVQAVGSVLTLAGVYWATKKQAQTAISQVHEEAKIGKKNKLEKVTTIVEAISDLVQRMQDELISSEVEFFANSSEHQIKILLDLSIERHLIEPLADTLKSTENSPVSSKEMALDVVRLGLYLKGLEVYVSAALAGPWGNPDLKRELERLPENEMIKQVIFAQQILNNNLIKHLSLIQNACDKLSRELKKYGRGLS